MLVHVVLFNFKAGVGDEKRKQVFEKAREMLPAIPGVMNLMGGKNIDPRGEFEYALSMYFENEKALAKYRDHPDHVRFRDEEFLPFLESRKGLDYLE